MPHKKLSVKPLPDHCPHCKEDGITCQSKLLSGTAAPARCKICGKASSISGLTLGTSGFVSHFLFVGAAIASFLFWSLWPLILSIVALVLFNLCLTKWAPLKPMTEDQAKKERITGYVYIGVLILLIVFAGISNE